MKFDWERMPQILAERRAIAVNELIKARSEPASMFWRGKIEALDALARMPEEEEEERAFREQQGEQT